MVLRFSGSRVLRFSGSQVLRFSGSRVLRLWLDACGRRAIVAAERARLIPAATWLAGYRTASVRPDLVAGLTLAAYLLPAGIGDAS